MATELKKGDKITIERTQNHLGWKLDALTTEVIYVQGDYLQTFDNVYRRTERWNWAYLGGDRYRLAPIDFHYFAASRIARKVDE